MNELYNLCFDCYTEDLLIGGGHWFSSTGGGYNLAVMNSTSGAIVSQTNVFGPLGFFQDVVDAKFYKGNYHTLIAKEGAGGQNSKINSNTGTNMTTSNWSTIVDRDPFKEIENAEYLGISTVIGLAGQSANNRNSIAVNDSHIFIWDGEGVSAYNRLTGAHIANAIPTTTIANPLLNCGGIHADECDNIYLGHFNGIIKVYSFNGTTFTAQNDIQIPGVTNVVIDIEYNPADSQLYVCGKEFVAKVTPTQNCAIPPSNLTYTLSANCDGAKVDLQNGDPNLFTKITWKDLTTNTIAQTIRAKGITSDSLQSGLTGNTYEIEIIEGGPCAHIRYIDTFVVGGSTTTTQDVTLCFGQTFNWNNQVLNSSGVYSDTIDIPNDPCDSISVVNLTVMPDMNLITTHSLCDGDNVVINGSTYTNSTIFTDSYQSVDGCDSNQTHIVNIGETTYGSVSLVLCYGIIDYNNKTYTSPGIYSDTLVNSRGCDSIISIDIFEPDNLNRPFVPNAFSPNGDDNNDKLKFDSWQTALSFKIAIYNRWGQQVFETSDPLTSWDGTIDGQAVPIGTFFYYVEAKTDCGKVKRRGDITVIR